MGRVTLVYILVNIYIFYMNGLYFGFHIVNISVFNALLYNGASITKSVCSYMFHVSRRNKRDPKLERLKRTMRFHYGV